MAVLKVGDVVRLVGSGWVRDYGRVKKAKVLHIKPHIYGYVVQLEVNTNDKQPVLFGCDSLRLSDLSGIELDKPKYKRNLPEWF